MECPSAQTYWLVWQVINFADIYSPCLQSSGWLSADFSVKCETCCRIGEQKWVAVICLHLFDTFVPPFCQQLSDSWTYSGFMSRPCPSCGSGLCPSLKTGTESLKSLYYRWSPVLFHPVNIWPFPTDFWPSLLKLCSCTCDCGVLCTELWLMCRTSGPVPVKLVQEWIDSGWASDLWRLSVSCIIWVCWLKF